VSSVTTTAGGLYDVAILDDWAFAVGDKLASWSLTASPAMVSFADINPSGAERAIAVVPGFAFTADASATNPGRIFSWDIANPGAPRQIGTSSVGGASNTIFHALIALDPNLLIAISPSKPGGAGRDVTVLDRSNPTALSVLGQLDVPDFDALDGAVYGTTLYLVGADAGVAIVDISNPSSPQHLATIDTPGIARAVAVSGPDEIVVADGGGPGLTFIDVADRTRPLILGSQPLVGNATDVRVIGDEILVATDHHVQIVRRP
ncbi:MAG: hypothetical protein LC732_02895, partial [Acidobacteria bacterium]|nr:hypothetical protein [Acidobacteriota bacterium]